MRRKDERVAHPMLCLQARLDKHGGVDDAPDAEEDRAVPHDEARQVHVVPPDIGSGQRWGHLVDRERRLQLLGRICLRGSHLLRRHASLTRRRGYSIHRAPSHVPDCSRALGSRSARRGWRDSFVLQRSSFKTPRALHGASRRMQAGDTSNPTPSGDRLEAWLPQVQTWVAHDLALIKKDDGAGPR